MSLPDRHPHARLAGVDLSLNSTGVATSQGVRTVTVKGLRGILRVRYVNGEVLDELVAARVATGMSEGADAPMLVAVEGYSFASRHHRLCDIAELKGVLLYALDHHGVRTCNVPPASLKKYATNNGNADKTVVMAAVERVAPGVCSNNDEADAYVLRDMALTAYGQPAAFPATDWRMAALETVDWPAL